MNEQITKKQMLEEEIQTILNCDHDFYGDNPLLRENSKDVAKESLFCKKCGNHFIRIISVYRGNLFNPDKYYLSPKCQICGFQCGIDKFVSEDWLQIPYSVDNGEHGTIIYVCPDCIAKKANIN